jgi:hypothetical protein
LILGRKFILKNGSMAIKSKRFKTLLFQTFCFLWAHLGSNQGPSRHECRDALTNLILGRKFILKNGSMAIKSKRFKTLLFQTFCFLWAHLGSNQGPPDYESVVLWFYMYSYIYKNAVNALFT